MDGYPCFLSLGVEAEDITLGTYRKLRAAERIFVAGTLRADGGTMSRALEILTSAGIDAARVEVFTVPMDADGEAAQRVYEGIAARMAVGSERVVLATIGDTSIYSTLQGIAKHLHARGVACYYQPGVPSFVHAAALAGIPLVERGGRLLVVDSVADGEEFMRLLRAVETLVLLKVKSSAQSIREIARREQGVEFHYFEYLGLEGREFHSQDRDVIAMRDFPYLSLLIARRK